MEDGIDQEDALWILEEAGGGLPFFCEWQTRLGCYFCFYQRKAEWIRFADRHPDLFERSVLIEFKVLKDAVSIGTPTPRARP